MRFVVQGARKGISFGFAHRPRVATFGEEAHVAARVRIPDVGDGVTNAAVIEARGCNAALCRSPTRDPRAVYLDRVDCPVPAAAPVARLLDAGCASTWCTATSNIGLVIGRDNVVRSTTVALVARLQPNRDPDRASGARRAHLRNARHRAQLGSVDVFEIPCLDGKVPHAWNAWGRLVRTKWTGAVRSEGLVCAGGACSEGHVAYVCV